MQEATRLQIQPKPSRRWFSRDALLGYVMIAPLTLWLGATILYPLGSAIYLSFLNVRVIGTGGEFIGLDNYSFVLSRPDFWESLGRSVVWVIANALLQTILAFAAALILNQRFRGRSFARIWVILSWIVPTVVVVIIWRWMLGTSGGIVNYLLVASGITPEPIGFFSSRELSQVMVILVNSWRWFPLMALLILAGIQGIPRELYEAAAVDGANGWQRFWNITMPGLQQVLFVLGLVGTLWSVNVFDVIWLLTGGGPSEATTTLPVYIYEMGFKEFRLSRAAASSVLMGIILLVFAVAFIRFASPRAEDER
jgi:multiple sugar transport system permease protein